MEKYSLVALIYRVSHEAMDELMRTVFGDIKARPRLFGYDILLETEAMRLFCCTVHNDGREWSLNADYNGPLRDLTEILSGFTQRLIDAGYNYYIGYSQIDENGDEVSEEVSLSHPEFDELYSQYLRSVESKGVT